MIFALAILGFVGVGLLAAFWDDIVKWLKKAINKVKELIKHTVAGVKIFLRKVGEAVKEISKHYSQQNGRWHETVVTREIPENEVPSDILSKVRRNQSQDLDITNELELQLSA